MARAGEVAIRAEADKEAEVRAAAAAVKAGPVAARADLVVKAAQVAARVDPAVGKADPVAAVDLAAVDLAAAALAVAALAAVDPAAVGQVVVGRVVVGRVVVDPVVVDPVVVDLVEEEAEVVVKAEEVAVANNAQNDRNCRLGVTLLELILAMSLSILVLMAISMAINIHFRVLDVRRTNVEEARLASAVLKHMADDLRSAVQYTPPDLSGLESLTASLTSAGTAAGAASQIMSATGTAQTGGGQRTGGQQGGQGTGGQGTGGQGGNQSGGGQSGGQPSSAAASSGQTGASGSAAQSFGATSSQPSAGRTTSATGGTSSTASATSAQASSFGTTSTSSSETTTEETTTATTVGFYGTSTELRFDISRLPRVDQYETVQTSSDDPSSIEFPSDIKTVVFFLQSDENGSPLLPTELGGRVGYAEPSTTGRGRGLMRSQQDRAVLSLAESSGSDIAVYSAAKMLAEEVVGLQFQYFDGTEWLEEWDSSTTGTLPRAVKIMLTLQPTYAMSEAELAKSPTAAAPPEFNYSLVVRLPSAPLVTPTATEETATDSSSTSSTPAASSSSQGGTP